MPRSARSSEDESETKAGRRTRGFAASVVDSPLRRSSRIKPSTKQNESSPDSPMSDTGSNKNPRLTRQRLATVEKSTANEKQRTLRSRKGSISSDISELTEADTILGTPTRKTRSVLALSSLNEVPNTRTRRNSRASSEATSPPSTTRVTRKGRASSEEKTIVKTSSEQTGTPIKTRRRASILPSEATVAEEREETNKTLVVELTRTIPEVREDSETESLNLSKSLTSEEKLPSRKSNSNKGNKSISDKQSKEKDEIVKGPQDITAGNTSLDNYTNVEEHTLAYDANRLIDDKLTLKDNDTSTTSNAITEIEDNIVETLSQSNDQGPLKEIDVKRKKSLDNSMLELNTSSSDKENQTGNIISDASMEENTESIISSTILDSAKPLSASPMCMNKSIIKTHKSPANEAALTKRRYSKELTQVRSPAIVPPEEYEIIDIMDDTIIVDTPPNERNRVASENQKKNIGSEDIKSSEKTGPSENLKENISSLNISITTDTSTSDEIETINGNTTNSTIKDDKCQTNESNESKMLNNSISNDANISAETLSCSALSDITSPKTSDVSPVINTQPSTILEGEISKNVSSNTKDRNKNVLSSETAVLELSDVCQNPKDSLSTKENNDDVIVEVKSTQSFIVTETPAKRTDEVPSKDELSTKTSALDASLSARRKSVDKLKLKESEQKSEVDQEINKQKQAKVKGDDNDFDTNLTNLFQDIPAKEWNEKNSNLDNNSMHSISTEKLENESEVECDLVLVDREAWLAAEGLKGAKQEDGFEYDSDDTFVLKCREDALKGQKATMDTVEETCQMDVSEDESSKSSPGNVHDTTVQKANTEDVENMNVSNRSVKKQAVSINQDEFSEKKTSKLNEKRRKSTGEESLSKSLQGTEITKDINQSVTDSKLNKSEAVSDGSSKKKRKSLNKSVQIADPKTASINALNTSINEDDKCKSDDEPEESESTAREDEVANKRKSLNKSKSKESKMDESIELINRSQTNSSSKKTDKNRSFNNDNNTSTNKIKPRRLDADLSHDDDTDSPNIGDTEDTSSAKKDKFVSSRSKTIQIGSNSFAGRNIIDSDSSNSSNERTITPKLEFTASDSEDSDDGSEKSSVKSIDSDIRREYNLGGETISKYSDDDVPGDDCRASESEYSDPEDAGSDLADFVVNDDEIEDEDEENEDFREDVETIEKSKEDEDENAVDDEDSEKEEEEGEVEKVSTNEKDDTEGENEDEENPEENEVNSEVIESCINAQDIDKAPETSMKGKNKTDKSMDTSLPKTKESKKKRKSKTNISHTDENEEECNLSNVSVSNSLKMKNTKSKQQDSDQFVEKDGEQLNESEIIPIKKRHKLNKSMECSTPKLDSSKHKKFETSVENLDVTGGSGRKKSTTKTEIAVDGVSLTERKTDNISSKAESSFTKQLSELNDEHQSVLHKSLPANLIESGGKTNLSRRMSSAVDELNKTTLPPTTETPRTKFLRKDKLNESAPTLKLGSEYTKLLKRDMQNKQNNTLMEPESQETIAEEPSIETTQEVSSSLKKKLLKVADSILDTDQIKRKKRKRAKKEKSNTSQSDEDEPQENIVSEISKKKSKQATSKAVVDTNNSEEVSGPSISKKKKKKKAALEVEETTVEEVLSQEDLWYERSEASGETVIDKNKKKTKKRKHKNKTEGVTECTSTDADNQVVAKKKVKADKELAEPEEVSAKKLSKNKAKLELREPADVKTGSNKAFKKLKQSKVEASDSDEAPEVVAFSKAREEAFTVIKHAADNIKATKDLKKMKQREHLEKMRTEKQAKIQKLQSKYQLDVPKKGLKRLSDDFLEQLTDLPPKPLKKRKLSRKEDQILPSRSMFNLTRLAHGSDMQIENDFVSVSSCGGTTEFGVVNLQKVKKKTKKVAAVSAFKQKMLARNFRQPVSAYLMHLEKQKASGKDKLSNRQF